MMRQWLRLFTVLSLVWLAAQSGWAAPGPENVLVIVNAGVADSVTLAQEYVRLRQIPPGNVLYLKGVPAAPVISAAEFRTRILTPIVEAIRGRGLSKQIACVAYSCGFPYAVDISEDMKGRTYPRYITQPASLTGLTYMYEQALRADTSYLDMQTNWYYRGIKRPRRSSVWSESDQRTAAALRRAAENAAQAARTSPTSDEAQQQLKEALALAEYLAAKHSDSAELLYDLACLRALNRDPNGAMRALTAAVEAGWLNVTHTETDPDLASLRGRADFQALIQRMKTQPIRVEDPQPFRAGGRWDAAHQPTRSGAGRAYLLSAMLGYVGGAANTLDEALACLRRSVGADHSKPRGTIYFMASSDAARTGPRRWGFEPARQALARLGVRAEVLDGVLPANRPDVAGAVVGAATFDWKSCGSTILPGAFCDHLTSFAGAMQGAGQTLLSEWIRHGAAGSSGTVTEPYNLQAKFPTPFLHVFYAAGCTLAEAFYQSVSGPYQQLLVGDPLCTPWAPRVRVSVTGVRSGDRIRRTTRIKVGCAGATPVRRYELYIDGRLAQAVEAGQPLTLDPAPLRPGEHEVRIVAVAGALEWRGGTILRVRVEHR